ncbi:MAG TPA: hypothetical protein VHO70_02180 [Chitinispirillaceae bacterium]|nr:hypothetical protein [Chitinispirillaceae bacterium]
MKKIIEFLSSNGIYVMMSGFLIALTGVILMLIAQKNIWEAQARSIALAVAISGFVLYLVGRIFVGSQQKKRRQNSSSSHLSSKE